MSPFQRDRCLIAPVQQQPNQTQQEQQQQPIQTHQKQQQEERTVDPRSIAGAQALVQAPSQQSPSDTSSIDPKERQPKRNKEIDEAAAATRPLKTSR